MDKKEIILIDKISDSVNDFINLKLDTWGCEPTYIEVANHIHDVFIAKLQQQNKELQDKLNKCVEALKFYGEPSNWELSQKMNFSYHDMLDSKHNDWESFDKDDVLICGKRARKTLKEVSEL